MKYGLINNNLKVQLLEQLQKLNSKKLDGFSGSETECLANGQKIANIFFGKTEFDKKEKLVFQIDEYHELLFLEIFFRYLFTRNTQENLELDKLTDLEFNLIFK